METLTTFRVIISAASVVALALATSAAAAEPENLPDPTKPPVGFMAGELVASGPMLQSILIAPTRRIAVISGKTVHVGDSVDDAKVLSINENEVVLKSGKSRQVLRLYPVLRKAVSDDRPGGKLDGPGQQR